jgi:hypothetical protein
MSFSKRMVMRGFAAMAGRLAIPFHLEKGFWSGPSEFSDDLSA